jgi:hypothetical protein
LLRTTRPKRKSNRDGESWRGFLLSANFGKPERIYMHKTIEEKKRTVAFELDDKTLAKARQFAAQAGITVDRFFEQAIEEGIEADLATERGSEKSFGYCRDGS